MTSKSGVHLIKDERKNFEEFLSTIRDAGAKLPVVHIVDSFGVAEQIKKFLPDTHIIGRLNDKDGQHLGEWQIEWNADPRGAAEDYYRKVRPTWDAHPLIDTWGFLNEVNNPFYKEQADFNIRMIELTDKPLCLWNSSVGTPDYWVNEHLPYESVARSCKVAKASGLPHVLGLHEYAFVADLLEDAYKNHKLGPHLVLRYRRLASYLERNNALIPIVLTEVGQGGGYRFVGNDAWMADMRWYDSEVRKDDYVKSVAWWTLGKWEQANIENVLPELAEYIVAEHIDEPDPDPDPSECKPRLRYKRVYHYIEHTEERPALYADRLAVWMESDKTHGTYGNSLDDALHGPGVDAFCILYGIERDRQMEFKAFRTQYYPAAKPLEFKPIPDGEPEPPQPGTIEFIYPVRGERFVTSPFGLRGDGFHFGVDLRAPMGERVYAAADGVVEFVGYDTAKNGGFGYYVRLGHPQWGDVKTFYAHLLDDEDGFGFPPPVGEKINASLHMAYADDTGNSRGSHLHWGLKIDGVWRDPMPYLCVDQRPEPPPPPQPDPDTHVPLAMLHLKAAAGGNIVDAVWQEDMAMVRDTKMNGVKWTSNNQVESVFWVNSSTGIPTENMIIRLFFAGNDPGLLNARNYVELQTQWIDTAQEAGMLIEIHNEPNLRGEWPLSALEFSAWFSDVAGRIHTRWPNARVGFPGLSPQPNTKEFYQACYGAIQLHADWIGVHTYFSTDGSGDFGIDNTSIDRAGGRYWENVINWIPPNIPIWLTEFADNGNGSDADRARRTAEYFVRPTDSWQWSTRIKGLVCYISQDENFPLQAWNMNDKMIAAVANR